MLLNGSIESGSQYNPTPKGAQANEKIFKSQNKIELDDRHKSLEDQLTEEKNDQQKFKELLFGSSENIRKPTIDQHVPGHDVKQEDKDMV